MPTTNCYSCCYEDENVTAAADVAKMLMDASDADEGLEVTIVPG